MSEIFNKIIKIPICSAALIGDISKVKIHLHVDVINCALYMNWNEIQNKTEKILLANTFLHKS